MAACLHALHDTLPSSFILDGELVIQNQQGALLPFREVSVMLGKEEKQLKEGSSVRLCIFDLLFLEHQDLTLKPLAEQNRSPSAAGSASSALIGVARERAVCARCE